MSQTNLVLLQVLSALMSTDNNKRKEAEQFLQNSFQTNYEPTLSELLSILISDDYEIVIRSFVGVLIRRSIEKHYSNSYSNSNSNSNCISEELLERLRSLLLTTFLKENNPLLLKRIAHIIAQICCNCSWNGLIPTIINTITLNNDTNSYSNNDGNYGGNSYRVVSVLNLIEILSDYEPDAVANSMEVLGPFLFHFLSDTNTSTASVTVPVQIACAKATAACLVSIEEEECRNAFRPAIEPIIRILGVALSQGEESDSTTIMDYLTSVAQAQPVFFKGSMDGVVSAMLAVAGSQSLEFSTRAMALELMVTLTETAPALSRRCNGLVQGLIPLAMQVMCELEDSDADWAKEKYTEDDNSDEHAVVGDEAIERLATGLGGKTVSDVVLSHVHQYAAHSNSAYRRAAVAAMARLAEGSKKHFRKYMEQALNFLLSAVVDPSPRVRYEAIQAVGRFAALYQDSVKVLVEKFLPPIASLLQDPTQCDRVRGHAASALINLVNPENCDAEDLQNFLDPLLTAIVSCLQSAPLEVQSPCLVLLGCIAQVASDGFAPYYSSFMPGIKSVLVTATSPELAVLRGKAMECVGLVGEAVGIEVFAQDALEIMQLFVHAMAQDSDRETTFDYILPACARISKALGAQFEPFLPTVMDPLLKGAVQTIEFSMVDVDDEDADDDGEDQENGIESAVITLGGGVKKRVTLNTHSVQQKNQAARIIYEFAVSLRGNLRSYIIPSLQALLQLVTEKHSADIRSSASLAISKTFDAYLHAIAIGSLDNSEVVDVLNSCVAKLLEALKGEINSTSRTCAAESLRDVLTACYTSGVETADGLRDDFLAKPSLDVSKAIANDVMKQCGDCLQRRKEKELAVSKHEGYDAEDVANSLIEELEEEDELLSILVDAIGFLLKLHGEAFMDYFDQTVAPAFSIYLSPSQPEALQAVAVCLVDDAIEFGGSSSLKYISSMLPVLLRNSQSEHVTLRQCSVYGIAKACCVAPELIKDYLVPVINCIMEMIDDPLADEDEKVGATENAIFALGAICTNPIYREAIATASKEDRANGATAINISNFMSRWLTHLPLKNDEQEAKMAHKLLCDVIEQNDSVVMGDNFSNLKEILRIIAEVLESSSPYVTPYSSPTKTVWSDINSPQSMASSPSRCSNPDDESLAHPSTIIRMQAIIRQFTSMTGTFTDKLQSAFSSLAPQLQDTLKAIL